MRKASRNSRGSGTGLRSRAALRPTVLVSPVSIPFKYNLLFERFLNPERVSMPDFDIDFCYERRQEVIDYVVRQVRRRPCGADRHLRHHGGAGLPSGMWGGRLGMPYGYGGSVLPSWCRMELNMTLDQGACHLQGAARSGTTADPQVRELIDMAHKIEGHAAPCVHSCGGRSYHPETAGDELRSSRKNDEAVVTQFTMTTLGRAGPAENGLSWACAR